MSRADDEIRWVKAQQPAIEPPDPDATARARAVLLSHAERSRRASTPARWRRGGAVLTAAAAVAVAAAIAALMIAPRPNHAGIGSALTPHASGGPAPALVALANHVAAASVEGDATLVEHTNDVQGEQPFTGADLYLDDGRYYYAETAAGLPAAVQAGPQDWSLKGLIDAMSSSSASDPQSARAAFLQAANPLYGGDVLTESTAQQDNVIWVASIDVLGAAYGRPAVLAGTLRALSTVDGVTVTHDTTDGTPTLEISMAVPAQSFSKAKLRSALHRERKLHNQAAAQAVQKLLYALERKTPKPIPAHSMTATVDASTGAMLRYTDIGLDVTYHVTRVDASQYGAR